MYFCTPVYIAASARKETNDHNDYGNENDKKAKSVKVASWPYSNADTWLWCQKSLQDYLQKIRLNVEKTMNVKKILPLLQKISEDFKEDSFVLRP